MTANDTFYHRDENDHEEYHLWSDASVLWHSSKEVGIAWVVVGNKQINRGFRKYHPKVSSTLAELAAIAEGLTKIPRDSAVFVHSDLNTIENLVNKKVDEGTLIFPILNQIRIIASRMGSVKWLTDGKKSKHHSWCHKKARKVLK